MTPPAQTVRESPESGRIALLTLGLVAVVLALILVITAATSIQLQRKQAQTLADQLARVGAVALDDSKYYREASSLPPPSPAAGLVPALSPAPSTDAGPAPTSVPTPSPAPTPLEAEGAVEISTASVRQRVSAAFSQLPPAVRHQFSGLQLVNTATPDGRICEVRLRIRAKIPLIPAVLGPWKTGIIVDVTGRAQAG